MHERCCSLIRRGLWRVAQSLIRLELVGIFQGPHILMHGTGRAAPLMMQYLLLMLLLVEYVIGKATAALDLHTLHERLKRAWRHTLCSLVLCHVINEADIAIDAACIVAH